MAEHYFHLKANWPGNRNDVGEIHADQLSTKVSIPKEMDGPGIGTNPDEMLLGAAATCYIITLAAMLERSKIVKHALDMESTAVVDVTNGVFTYKKIIHRPLIVIDNENDRAITEKLAKKAETSCMISRAIKGNVEIQLEPTISIHLEK
ncbi:OsmC family protein [Psychrobacillus sp. OK032]|uniref:OsmC family protein n=1 Tax=Psychrobacillus sp. OK032 TaxID=1884358 RepID=UPI0008BAD379|nr:OsmC family protein [Psychrobacillus sp. OK032]SES09067.1 peroxiredoxin, SACOL1771 subfamily [Psychrobacillus sp. OK032]